MEKYHNLKALSEPNWTATKTAEMLGSSDSDVHKRRMVAKELHNPVVNNNLNYSTALGIVTRNNERKKTSILEKLEVIESGEEKIKAKAPLLNVDFTEWSKMYSGPKFNFIHCDFPYGINSNNHDQGGAKAFGGYEDSPEIYWQLLESLALSMNNVVAESAHLMFWFSMEFYQATFYDLTQMGWTVNKFPLYWHKSDNLGILSDPSRSPRRVVETCLFASRGDRLIVRSISNHVSHPTTKAIHMSEKPIGMLTKLMEMFVDEHSTVLDPTCGSANAIHAAINRGAKTTLGLEINPEFYNKAKETF